MGKLIILMIAAIVVMFGLLALIVAIAFKHSLDDFMEEL